MQEKIKNKFMPSELQKEEVKLYKEILFTAVRERYAMLPTISTLSATLLVVATFNPDLIEITCFVKITLSILLTIIPLSLFGYLWELKKTEDKAVKWFEKYGRMGDMKLFDKVLSYLPWIMFCVLSVAIISIIVFIFIG